MTIRDRIRELRRVQASDLLPHPRNWRQHPTAQLDALKAILDEVGWADCVLARETPDGLQLIDGHARANVAPDAEIPVLVLDVSEEETQNIPVATRPHSVPWVALHGTHASPLAFDPQSSANNLNASFGIP